MKPFKHSLRVVVWLVALSPFCLYAQVPHIVNYQGRIVVSNANFEGTGRFKFALVNGGTATTAQATATASVVNGFLVGLTVTSGGAGYTTPPAVTITDSTGSGAVAAAAISGGAVTNIAILNAGSGYSATPTITLAAPPIGTSYVSFWSNDSTSNAGGEPTAPVLLSVSKGLYGVALGDTTIANMTSIAPSVFTNSDVRLRVWFSDGTNAFQMLAPDQRIAAVGYAMMAGNVPDQSITSAKLAPGASAANLQSSGQSGVASGGVVLSDQVQATNLLNAGYVKVGQAQLTAEAVEWRTASNDTASPPRISPNAVWTGKEFILWGGYVTDVNGNQKFLSTGSRYNPTNDTWVTVSTNGSPLASSGQAAVWTGKEMIVWGELGGSTAGARYNPTNNSWASVSTNGAPIVISSRSIVAVWTGKEVIFWGSDSSGVKTFGGRYNPTNNTWSPVSLIGSPSFRSSPTAVWTGKEMIVWGGGEWNGFTVNTGARYNPTNDVWTAMSTNGAPLGRWKHTSVWTGTEMVVFGGSYGRNVGSGLNTGGRYNPVTDSWATTSVNSSVAPRYGHLAFWIGSEMLVYGGRQDNNGGRYDTTADSWVNTGTPLAPSLNDSTAVWANTEMIVYEFGQLYVYTPQGEPQRTLFLYMKP